MLTVLTPAATSNLSTLAAYKARFGITTADQDAQIVSLIARASSAVEGYCQRVFGVVQYRQTVRPPYTSFASYDPLMPGFGAREPDCIVIEAPGPVVSIDYVAAVGAPAPLVEWQGFERDGFRLFRLSNDVRVMWAFRKIVVDFTVGYRLPGDTQTQGVPDLPAAIEGACLDLANRASFVGSRDPSVRREMIVGVMQTDYTQLGASDGAAMKQGIPADIAARLDPYVYRAVA